MTTSKFGQFSIQHLCLLIVWTALTVWFGIQCGRQLTSSPSTPSFYFLFVFEGFVVCLGAVSGGLIGHFGPGAIVGLLISLPMMAIWLEA